MNTIKGLNKSKKAGLYQILTFKWTNLKDTLNITA